VPESEIQGPMDETQPGDYTIPHTETSTDANGNTVVVGYPSTGNIIVVDDGTTVSEDEGLGLPIFE